MTAPAEALRDAAVVVAAGLVGTEVVDVAASSGDDTADCIAVASSSDNHCTRKNCLNVHGLLNDTWGTVG